MFTGCIYKITSPSGNVYIGQTINFHNRLIHHRKMTRPNSRLAKAIKKYGWENLTKEIVETIETETKEELDNKLCELEIFYIKLFDSYNNGYNCTTGGDGTAGRFHSEETKQLLKEANTGRKLSEEHKKNISIGLKNNPRIVTEETKEKIRKSKLGDKNPNYGKSPTEETRAKMSTSQIGRHHTQESKDKISQSKKGIKRPKEVMEKVAKKKRKAVYQLDINYNLIKKWPGVNDAIEATRIFNLGKICRGKMEQRPPYIWMFEEDYNKRFGIKKEEDYGKK